LKIQSKEFEKFTEILWALSALIPMCYVMLTGIKLSYCRKFVECAMSVEISFTAA